MQYYQDFEGNWIPVPKPTPLADVERNAILNALAYTDGEQALAAKLLGISAGGLSHKIKRLGLVGLGPYAAKGHRRKQ